MLEAHHLAKTFGAIRVLDDVSLTLEKGEVHAILGENGEGKSTLAKLSSGYLRPTEGNLTLDGRVVSFGAPATPKRRASY